MALNSWVENARVATTANLPALSGLLTIDGIAVASGDRVLVKDQTTASQNGVYIAATTAWSRASDVTTGRITPELMVCVGGEGTANSHTQWKIVIPGNTITVETTNLTFSRQFVRANVRDFGAKGNGGTVHDGQTTASSTTLTSPSGSFTAANIPAGTPILVVGAGSGGANLVTTATYASSTTVTLATAAGTTVSGATILWGSDDSAAIAAAINATSTFGGALLFPPGVYVVGSAAVVSAPSNVQATFEESALIAPFGATVTLNGRVTAHSTQQVFSGVGTLSAITTTGSPPSATVSGNPVGSYSFVVEILSGASLSGGITFQYSLNGGSGWSSAQSAVTPSGIYSYLIPGTGVTINFPTSSSYAIDQTWVWTSTPPVIVTSQASHELSVKWWGAMGDGVTDDTAAIQLAFNAAEQTVGREVLAPAGNYLVTAPAKGAALYIANTVTLRGVGVNGTTITVNGPGTGLVIESAPSMFSSDASNTIVERLSLQGGDTAPLDFIVVHAGYVTIQDVALSTCSRYGILIDSGTVGTDILGVSIAGNGTYLYADQWTLTRIFGFECPANSASVTSTTMSFVQPAVGVSVTVEVESSDGLTDLYVMLGASDGEGGGLYEIVSIDSPTSLTLKNLGGANSVVANGSNTVPPSGMSTSVQVGALVFAHGDDGHLGVATLVNAIHCNVAISENSLGGNTYIQCYSQQANMGYIACSAAPSAFLRCGSEDFDLLSSGTTPGVPHMFINGSLASAASDSTESQFETIGGGTAGLTFERVAADGSMHTVQIPATAGTDGPGPLYFSRQTALTISEVTPGTPNTITTATTNSYVTGDWINISGGVGTITDLNGTWKITVTTPGSTFTLDGSVGSGSYTAGSATATVTSYWYFGYEWDGETPWPYLTRSFLWKHLSNEGIDTDLFGGPFGMTDFDHPCGVGLAIIGTPTMNSRRRWTYKQAAQTLTAGSPNIVYLNGGSGFAFADPATGEMATGPVPWPNARRRVSVTVEFPNATFAVTGAIAATPIEITTAVAHGYSTGETVFITGVQGVAAANGSWVITVTSATQFTLDSSSGSGIFAGSAGTSMLVNTDAVTALTAAGQISVNGYAYVYNSTNQLWDVATSINVANTCSNVTLVWEFEVFMQNYDDAP